MNFRREKTDFLSTDGKSRIPVYWWIPETPKAVLQLAHGMAEYILRYEPFAAFMAERGYVVCGGDHLGHGPDVPAEDLGFMGDKDGHLLMAGDMHTLTLIAKEQYPGLPFILFGHSMGSFLVRLYLSAWSADVDAAIICGTAGPNPAASAGLAVAKVIKTLFGHRHRSKLVDTMAFGSYLKRIENPVSKFDWLSCDPETVAAYDADPLCGYLFTICGFEALFSMLSIVSEPESAGKIRKDLPVLLIAGAEDPVGGYGEGVKAVRDMFLAAGISGTELELYEGARHEILNDTCRTEAMERMLLFCENINKD